MLVPAPQGVGGSCHIKRIQGCLQETLKTIGHFRVAFCLSIKTSLSAKPFNPYENEFCMQFYFHANQTHSIRIVLH